MRTSSSRIWRTVVFAGAMLATPLAGCGSSSHKQTTPEPTPAPAPQAVAGPQHDEAAAQRDADAKAAREQADLLAAQQFAAEEAARQAEEDRNEQQRLQRIRGSGVGPRGRGFVLS
jgi:hypothetical protein